MRELWINRGRSVEIQGSIGGQHVEKKIAPNACFPVAKGAGRAQDASRSSRNIYPRKCSVVEVVPDAAASDGNQRGIASRSTPPSCSPAPIHRKVGVRILHSRVSGETPVKAGLLREQGLRRKLEHETKSEQSQRRREPAGNPPLRQTRNGSSVPLEHAEEQSSRARTSDGRWKASRCARTFVSLRGARYVGRVFGWFVARERSPNSRANDR